MKYKERGSGVMRLQQEGVLMHDGKMSSAL